jgi:arylsulfatase A-like enzyme
LYDPDPYSGPIRNRSTGIILDQFKRDGFSFSARDRQRLEALYDGEVTYHDRCFGRFVDRLRELGLLDDTCFVVTADHGEEFFEHDSAGHGHSLYQELLHVPLVVRCPGLAPAGTRLGQACSLVDIAPTVLEAAGLAIPESIEGRSLVADLGGAPPPITSASFSSQWDTGNDWELAWTVRIADWKLRMRGPGISYLHDVAADPRERNDLDDRYPIALRAARIALGQFLGAPGARDWASAGAATAAQPRRPRRQPAADEDAHMTPELCQQLRALGYMDACE